ncbi:O-methyltransferase [Aeromonas diversa CDC 2478-85]|uniref:O-methyltransferase n=1 Tax=Aeromonas diversa CDC 2478-85 TaxID=1268237 RepID=N9VPR0_9GAMM|nr:O-methyltransferase [Aeromonas diversa]ENY73331.1 O-methyltransferase [Aeromonas diversa CDC 2478-85]
MNLEALKRELELFGERHDAETAHHGQRMLNITRDTGEFLGVLVRATGAKRVLEVGTSNGYSTLWLAEAVRDLGGKVMTLERQESKRMLALANVERAGLLPWIELVGGDAEATLDKLSPGSIDLLFLDADRSRYQGWWPQLQRLLAPRGLLVVDNALSHAHELADWRGEVEADPRFVTSLVPVGKGEWLVTRR